MPQRSFKIGMLLAFIALLASSIVVSHPALAQATPTAITVGDTIKGEITDKAYELAYKFTGKKNDLIVVQAEADPDAKQALYSAYLRLLRDGKVLADTAKNYASGLILRLSKDGDYTLIVTRRDGKTGTDKGGFIMRVSIPDELTDGSTIDITRGEEKGDFYSTYYSLPDTADLFTLTYSITKGEPSADVAIFKVSPDGSTDTVGGLSGDLAGGSLMINPGESVFYMARVGVSRYDTNFDFSLARAAVKK